MEQDLVDRLLATDYVQMAIPAFLVLILCEAFLDWRRRLSHYRFADTLANIACGAVQSLTAVVTAAFLVQFYNVIYEHARLMTLPSWSMGGKAALAFLLFLAVDLGYYWGHRFSHRVHLAWAGHGVHHQSEEYNLSVALRQSAFQAFFTWFFYLPLALLGFSTAWYVSVASFVTMYQFWIHTRMIKTLGPLEWVLNTPSHHRVHHAINAPYIDKNYAGTLIIWDRMFGTFVKEGRECVYGTVAPLNSFNPVWAQVAIFWGIVKCWGRHRRFFDKLKATFAPPGWPDFPDLSAAPVQVKYDRSLGVGAKLYALLQFILLLGVGLFALDRQASLAPHRLYALLLLVILGLLSLGFLLDKKKWAPFFEGARIIATGALIVLLW